MIYITGDTHGATRIGSGVDGYTTRLRTDSFPEQKEMTRDDYVIICGDFGGIWNYDSRFDETKSAFKEVVFLAHGESSEEKHWLDWLQKKNFTILFCDGNHENFDRLESAYPEVAFCGGRAHQIRENVFHLMRGHIFDIDGCRIFVFGGAASHDIWDGILKPSEYPSEEAFKRAYQKAYDENLQMRVDHISWWSRELPTQEEMEWGIRNLRDKGSKVDYIVTHCGPQKIVSAAGYPDNDVLVKYFDTIADTVDFKRWFFGHYHRNRVVLTKYIMLYEQIVRIW